LDDQRRDGGTNSTLRTKEQGTHLTLNEHDDDDYICQENDKFHADCNVVYGFLTSQISRKLLSYHQDEELFAILVEPRGLRISDLTVQPRVTAVFCLVLKVNWVCFPKYYFTVLGAFAKL